MAPVIWLVKEGRPTLAIATLFPLAAPLVKQGGKVTLHIGGKLKHVPIEHVAWAEKYAEAVFDSKFTTWADSLSEVPESARKSVRELARELFPEITVPILRDVPGYIGKKIAIFDKWAFKIPGTTPPSYTLKLPPSMWALGEKQHKIELDTLFEILTGSPRPDNFVWHHHHLAGEMQLVERSIHIANKHDGPFTAGNWASIPGKVGKRNP